MTVHVWSTITCKGCIYTCTALGYDHMSIMCSSLLKIFSKNEPCSIWRQRIRVDSSKFGKSFSFKHAVPSLQGQVYRTNVRHDKFFSVLIVFYRTGSAESYGDMIKCTYICWPALVILVRRSSPISRQKTVGSVFSKLMPLNSSICQYRDLRTGYLSIHQSIRPSDR